MPPINKRARRFPTKRQTLAITHNVAISLNGNDAGPDFHLDAKVNLPADAREHVELPRLWAQARVQAAAVGHSSWRPPRERFLSLTRFFDSMRRRLLPLVGFVL